MADLKITQLTAATSMATADILPLVTNPGSSPLTQNITRANFMGGTNITQVVGTTETQTLTNKNLTSGTNTYPTFNQNTTGSAATLTTPRAIYGNNFDGSAALTQIIASTYGGTGNGFTKFSGPASSEKTFTLPNASTTILTTNALVTVAQGGSGAGTLTGLVLGNGTSAFTTVTAPSGTVVGTSDTQTLTNKRITRRVGSTTSSATPTINTDNVDIYKLTAQAADITSFTTNLSGTPNDGDMLLIQITGTAARAITWGTSFEASTVALPTTTVTTNRLDTLFIWNTSTSKWRCLASV